jgi:NitT/TauT family transport system ATP-binding protein
MQEQLLQTWARDKRTVLFITHDVEEAVYLAHRVVVMAARPGRIHEIFSIDLPFPRTEAVRLSPEFLQLRNQVWSAVYHQNTPAATGESA